MTIKNFFRVLYLPLLFFVGASHAEQNNIPSCYAANKMDVAPPPPKRAFLLLIDETTQFNNKLRESAWKQAKPLLQPGTSLTLVRFSAFSQSRYTTVSFSGLIEEGVTDSQRHSISVKKLKKFDTCLEDQKHFVWQQLQKAMSEAFDNVSSELAKSDVIAAMKDVSVLMKAATSPEKILFVMSDMLENSTISSFYEGNRVKKIDPKTELKKVKKEEMFGDFGNVKVWVMGAGLVPEEPGSKGVYRDPIRLKALHAFWNDYFKESKATLVEFGTPELKKEIR